VRENGDRNTFFGVYKNSCCGFEIVISVGSIFPDCPKHPNIPTQWTPIEIDLNTPGSDNWKSEPAA